MAKRDSSSLTEIQTQILQTIMKSKSARGIVPSMREIAEIVGLNSVASVSYQLDNLEEKGYIRRQENLSRNVEVLISPEGWDEADVPENVIPLAATTLVPMVGTIAAGGPLLAEQNIDEQFPLPKSLVGSGELFMLKVVGDSMINAAICDGDYVVIRSQKDCNKGEIVAAMIDGEATVKTFTKKDGHIWLMPANDDYKPINGDNAEILGIVTAVLRPLR